jgi:hypothetical protein
VASVPFTPGTDIPLKNQKIMEAVAAAITALAAAGPTSANLSEALNADRQAAALLATQRRGP